MLHKQKSIDRTKCKAIIVFKVLTVFTGQGGNKKEAMKQPLHLSGYGITLMVEHGNLIIQDGIASERRTITLYRDNQEYDHIIIPEYGGSISFEAISWLMVQGIAVTCICQLKFPPDRHLKIPHIEPKSTSYLT